MSWLRSMALAAFHSPHARGCSLVQQPTRGFARLARKSAVIFQPKSFPNQTTATQSPTPAPARPPIHAPAVEEADMFAPLPDILGSDARDLEGDANDPDIASLRELGNMTHAGSMRRAKRAARVTIGRRLYAASAISAHSSAVNLQELPFHIHTVRVSPDLQFITGEWHFEPNVPRSAQMKLPVKYSSFTLQSLVSAVGATLTRCLGGIRFELGDALQLKYVPHIRLVYQPKVRPSSAAAAMPSDAELSDFQRFNPFVNTEARDRRRTSRAAAAAPIHVVSTVSKKSGRQERHRAQIRREREERLANGTANGAKKFATDLTRTGDRDAAIIAAVKGKNGKKLDADSLRERQRQFANSLAGQ